MICVYYVNERQLYQSMLFNSVDMLRAYNKTIPIRVLFIGEPSDGFVHACSKLRIDIMAQPWVDLPGEESFFLINKYHLSKMPEESVLFLDCDTFIFDDVKNIFWGYKNYDFVACENRWMNFWDSSWLNGYSPFNTGVMLFNNGYHKRCFEEFPKICRDLRENKHYLSDWMRKHGTEHIREELALSDIVSRHDSIKYFDKKDCYNALWPNDLNTPWDHKIFHTYAGQWDQVYRLVRHTGKEKKIKLKLIR